MTVVFQLNCIYSHTFSSHLPVFFNAIGKRDLKFFPFLEYGKKKNAKHCASCTIKTSNL